MPESVMSKKERYINKYGISVQVAEILSSDKFYSDLFEQAHTEKNAKEIANLITTDLKGFADTKEQREQLKLTPKHLLDLADSILNNKITRNSGKLALQEIIKKKSDCKELFISLQHVIQVYWF